MNRIDLPLDADQPHAEGEMMHWQNYEVFVQQSRGDQHVHQGAVHAPNAEMALLFAKEQFGRREQCANIWVVKTTDVTATSYDDADMFKHAFDKSYREGDGYKVRVTIDSFKAELDASLAQRGIGDPQDPAPVLTHVDPPTTSGRWKTIALPDSEMGERKIFVRK
jgi:ring-1,2-phenylacetyl-CoA epoxidase subunit PaaB